MDAPLIQKKICLVGSFAVGKTSLIARFVEGIFSEKYLTTVGVKIDRKVLEIEGQSIRLIIWDLAGEDEFIRVRQSYLRGAHGVFYVFDGTRLETFENVHSLIDRVGTTVGNVPGIAVANKTDLKSDWEVTDGAIAALEEKMPVVRTSAKTGDQVEAAFETLTRHVLRSGGDTG